METISSTDCLSPSAGWLPAAEQEVEADGRHEAEEKVAGVADDPEPLEAKIREHGVPLFRDGYRWVSVRNASSSPAPVTSMSWTSSLAMKSARRVASGSALRSRTLSPWISTVVTPGRASRPAEGPPASEERMVRPPAAAFISVSPPRPP